MRRAVKWKMCLRVLGLLLALTAVTARGDAMPPLVAAALDQRPADAEARCAYTRTRIQGDHSKSERYHPDGSGVAWTLEAVNGRRPTEAEQRRYARDAGAHDRAHPLDFDLTSMVEPGSWRLLRQDEQEAVFQFKLNPTADIPRRVAQQAVGTLVVDKSRRRPVRATIENTGPAYIAPFVRLAEFSQQLRFGWDEALNAPVLAEVETRWQGRAFGVKKLNKDETLRYSDYQCRDMDAAPRGAP